MITLMLPPVPGTNTAHPALEIHFFNGANIFIHGKWIPVRMFGGMIDQVAAAAIAFYWYRHMCSHVGKGINHPLYRQAREEYDKWADIAAGSRDYDNAEIVAYKGV